jgi:protocatechuate 3,4-dioxygenase, beta subunit
MRFSRKVLKMKDDICRRDFLKLASSAVVLVPTLAIGASTFTACNKENALASGESKALAWKTTIVSDKEPGEALIISGTIYALDGKTPMEAATLWVYQTDATGIYSTSSGQEQRYTRIHGQMRTGADGHYEFRTIKPASYPGRTIPAHIHAYVSAPGFPEYWIDDFVFEGDPFITEDARKKHYRGEGAFASVLKLTKGSDGVLRGVRDIRIERCTNNCVRN